MNHRLSTIHARKTYTSDVTEIIDIDVADPISQLIIEIAVINGASAAPTAHALAALVKIEIVDGSEVLFALSGFEAEAVDWYHNHIQRSPWNPYLNGMETQRFIAINFGRYLWDPILALDPKKFHNLQLKISLDVDAGGVSPTGVRMQVWAALFDEKKIVPTGFLMHKELKSYVMTASGHEYTDLPTDYPYRKLFVQALVAGSEPNIFLDNIKLSEDQDKRIIVNHGFEDIFRTIAMLSPLYSEAIIGYVGTASTYGFCTPTARVNGMLQTWAAVATVAKADAFYDGDGGRFKVISTVAGNMQVLLQGWLPHGVYEIPFGDQQLIEDWFNVSRIGSLKADITAGSGAGTTNTARIFLQQMKSY